MVSLLLLCAAMSGCRDGAVGDDRIELVLITGGGTLGESSRAMARQFEQDHPHIRVRVVSTPGKQYYVKSLTMIAGRAPVDVMWLGQGFGMFASRGALLDLAPFIEADPAFNLDDYFERVVDWYRYENQLYGIPTGIDVEVLGYNREHFEQAGLASPDLNWTIDDLVAAGQQLTPQSSPNGRRERIGLGFDVIPLAYYGLRLLTPDDRAFGLNTPMARDWLVLNRRFREEEPILAARGDRESMDRLGSFIGGRISMMSVYTWDLADLEAQMKSPWDVVPVPLGPDGKRRAWASSAGFSIPHHSKHPQEAWLLLKYLVSASFQEQAMDKSIPALKSLQKGFVEIGGGSTNRQAFLDSLDYLEPTPRIGALGEVAAEWRYWRDRSLLGQIEPAEALTQAERQINRILAYHQRQIQ